MFLACQSYQELLIHPFHCWNVQFVWPLKKEMHSFPPLPVFPSFSSSWNRELSPRVTTACRSVSSPRRAVWSPSTAAAPWPCSCWPWVTSTSSGAHSASAASWGSTSPCDPPLPSPSPNEQYGGGGTSPGEALPDPCRAWTEMTSMFLWAWDDPWWPDRWAQAPCDARPVLSTQTNFHLLGTELVWTSAACWGKASPWQHLRPPAHSDWNYFHLIRGRGWSLAGSLDGDVKDPFPNPRELGTEMTSSVGKWN